MNYIAIDYNDAIVQVEFYLETACGDPEVIIVGVTYGNIGYGSTGNEYVEMPVRLDITRLLSDKDLHKLQSDVWRS